MHDLCEQRPPAEIDIEKGRHAIRARLLEGRDGPLEPAQIAQHSSRRGDAIERKPVRAHRHDVIVLADDKPFTSAIDDNSRGRGLGAFEPENMPRVHAGCFERPDDLVTRLVVADPAPKLCPSAEPGDGGSGVGSCSASAFDMLQRSDFGGFGGKGGDPVNPVEGGMPDDDNALFRHRDGAPMNLRSMELKRPRLRREPLTLNEIERPDQCNWRNSVRRRSWRSGAPGWWRRRAVDADVVAVQAGVRIGDRGAVLRLAHGYA